jgi:hypothetical protein
MQDRYEVRWSNGFWKLFDRHFYKGFAKFSLRKDARAAADRMNGQAARK